MRRIGLDEAGYGPNLGPLVLVCVTLRVVEAGANPPWWDLKFPADPADPSPCEIGDSKRILQRSNGRMSLARTVHSALLTLGQQVESLVELISGIAPADVEKLQAEPWYTEDSAAASRVDSGETVDLAGWLARRGCGGRGEGGEGGEGGAVLESIRARIVFPREFNAAILSGMNKAEFHAAQVRDLLASALQDTEDEPERVVATVDRLGGRKFYRPLVEDVAGERFPQTLVESASESRYQFERGSGSVVAIDFLVKADSSDWCVALASMVAKYTRERIMTAFNAFWAAHLPDYVPTAGYPVDAIRFQKDTEEERRRLGIPLESLWRLV